MAKKLTEQQRLAIVAKWRASGLSIPKFATTHSINISNLKYWVQRSRFENNVPAEQSFVKLRVPPSKPREFHPQLLTDPDLSLSTHPARVSTLEKHSSEQKALATFCTLCEANHKT